MLSRPKQVILMMLVCSFHIFLLSFQKLMFTLIFSDETMSSFKIFFCCQRYYSCT